MMNTAAKRNFYTKFGLSIVGALIVTSTSIIVADRSGGTLAEPVANRLWEVGVTITALILVAIGIKQSIAQKKLSHVFLVAVASGSAFWQETYGDWGTYLLYSADFWTYHWGETIWTSPVRCWWFIPGYIFFYTTLYISLQKSTEAIRRVFPEANPYLAATLIALPVFYIFDLALEGTAHGFGWWHYTYAFGPTLAVGQGHMPLVWPILEQVPFIALTVITTSWRSSKGLDVMETIAAAVTRAHSPSQLSILITWVITVNVVFLLTTILPLMMVRWAVGPASTLVP